MSRGDKIFHNHLKNESTQEKGNEFLQSEGLVSDILNDDVSSQTTYSKSRLCECHHTSLEILMKWWKKQMHKSK